MRITMVTDIRTLKTGGLPPSLPAGGRLAVARGVREHRMWNGGLSICVWGLHPPEAWHIPDGRGVCPDVTEGSPLQGVTEKQLPNQWRQTPPKALILKSFTWRSTRYWVHHVKTCSVRNIFSSNSKWSKPRCNIFSLSPFPLPNSLSLSESFSWMSALPYSCHFSSNVSTMLCTPQRNNLVPLLIIFS